VGLHWKRSVGCRGKNEIFTEEETTETENIVVATKPVHCV
jgi:hypothetical protein